MKTNGISGIVKVNFHARYEDSLLYDFGFTVLDKDSTSTIALVVGLLPAEGMVSLMVDKSKVEVSGIPSLDTKDIILNYMNTTFPKGSVLSLEKGDK